MGIAWTEEFADLIPQNLIATEAEHAPMDELLAQHLVKAWLQVYQQDFVKLGDRVIAIDFASGLHPFVWWGREPLGTKIRGHHGEASVLSRIDQGTRDGVRARFDAIDGRALQGIFEEFPDDWATREEYARIKSELLRTKPIIAASVLA
jgi:hypothetical protein